MRGLGGRREGLRSNITEKFGLLYHTKSYTAFIHQSTCYSTPVKPMISIDNWAAKVGFTENRRVAFLIQIRMGTDKAITETRLSRAWITNDANCIGGDEISFRLVTTTGYSHASIGEGDFLRRMPTELFPFSQKIGKVEPVVHKYLQWLVLTKLGLESVRELRRGVSVLCEVDLFSGGWVPSHSNKLR